MSKKSSNNKSTINIAFNKHRTVVILALAIVVAVVVVMSASSSSLSGVSLAPRDVSASTQTEGLPSPAPRMQDEKQGGEKQEQQASTSSADAVATTTISSSRDRFGITELHRTAAGGIEWSSKWDNGHARTFVNTPDPDDEWFDTAHGNGAYSVDGNGTLVASGDVGRMYVHDPANVREWSENLEITVYIKRVNETQLVDYSGLLIVARSNHGTNGDEDVNICDDRGYYAEALDDGEWVFQKETAHHLPTGYADAGSRYPWNELPRDKWIGVKYVIRNMDNNTQVKLELYRDMNNGQNGGTWEKITDFVDDGNNFGVGNGACSPNVNPALQLIHSFIDASSETKKPMLSVYIKNEFATMDYTRFDIREIDPISP